MPTPTARLGLQLLADSEDISPQRSNFQRIDDISGALWVADGVTPSNSTLFDGCIVAEITSGKIWIARNNGVGGFTKKYITYPWWLVAYTTSATTTNGWGKYGFNNFYTGKNSTSADMVSGQVKIPITGVYSGYMKARYVSNNTGLRSANVNLNNVSPADDTNTGASTNTVIGAYTHLSPQFKTSYNAGDLLSINSYQSSGGNLAVDFVVYITLEFPL